ncbi:MAG: isoleucine--tRNA ligase [Paludibacteraceae bacterium]|nr:isoleucine--tRNA ligase [Paludibacteraceae bacterium]MBQ5774831.1 isoleucine--tRNA ligase [Paludibacteraceae bacterium]
MKNFNEYKQLNLAQVSKDVLQQWEEEDLFRKSIDTREGSPSFLFFEGPPSANGMPGIHHVMARTIKDTFCRFKTMQGYQVKRKAGWDTHGLPVELGVEKLLGITKEDIGKKISVDEYNAACRREVMKYTQEWTNLTKQMGYWVDLDNPYITYDNKFIETLWWLLKELYKKGYLYKGYTIQPYSPAAGTGLSSHELNQPGCYRDVKDTTCTAQFLVKSQSLIANCQLPLYALAWTTTPWTLPSNTALCVGPKIDYVIVKGENPYTKLEALYLLAEARLAAYSKELGETPEVLWKGKGADLVGIEYEQLIPWANPGEGAFKIIPGDYVTTEDGTGIVHIAPTFGADDAFVAKKAGVPGMVFITKKGENRPMVDMTGKFFLLEDLDDDFVKNQVHVEAYEQWAGRYVKNAYDANLTDKDETLDVSICIWLKGENKAFRIEKHVHNYPHCWRTDKPVLYYPLDSWFVRSTQAREEMMKLNDTINWQPESTGTGRFGKWLENLNDWNLSRSRYWGTPLPIWRTEDGQEELCIGSIAELMQEIDKSIAAGFMTENPWPKHEVGNYSKENYDPTVIDLHRPYVDNIILCSPSGKPMKRELDLIDVWFDSGAMPYAQNHYPFENQDAPRTADFISEGVDQTRGWFFTLHAIHTMIEGSVAYKNVISNGLVLDKNGNKMSKRLGNAVDPFGALDKYGADAVRWYMLTNSSPWENLKFDPEGVDEIRRKFFGTLYNTYGFFALYANVDGWTPELLNPEHLSLTEIDKWVLSKLNSLVKEVTTAYEAYEPTKAGRAVSDFVQDDLSNWYVRLNRKRFWGGEMDADKQAAYYTLYTCLKTVAQLMAPNAPFYGDRLYRDLTGETVHLSQWPVADEALINLDLERSMSLAQQATSMILSLRKRAEKNVRQPLQKAVIPAPDQETLVALLHVQDLIKSEVNVKEMVIVLAEESEIKLVKKIKPNFKVLGKKVGGMMKQLAAAIAQMSQDDIAAFETSGTFELCGYSLVAEDIEIITEDMPGWLVANNGTITIALDIELTPALIEEGIARELINRIQNLRKSSGLDITDRIVLQLENRKEIAASVTNCSEYIASQVLATSITLVDGLVDGVSLDMDGYTLQCVLKRQ